jgi:hypothetical protein
VSGRAAGHADPVGHHSGMASAPRNPRLIGLYVVLVLLLLISGLLAIGGQPLYALLVLGIATLLNVRMLMLRNRLHGRPEK